MGRRQTKTLMEKFNGECVYCRRSVTAAQGPVPAGPLCATADHFLPKVQGGSSEPVNIVLACLECNQVKGGFNPYEWEKFLRLFGPENMKRVMEEIVRLNDVAI